MITHGILAEICWHTIDQEVNYQRKFFEERS